MAEAALGLALGVLPIIIEAIKAYESTYDKIKTFRQVSREVGRLLKKFERQMQFFENECHLLLRLVLKNDGWKAKEMMENPAHHLWTDHDLHNRVTELLNNNYGTCKSIAEEIKISLDGLEEELIYLDKVVNQQRFKGESIRDTIRRLRQSVIVSFEKSRYEKKLENLRNQNADLRLLRSQISDFQHQTCFSRGYSGSNLMPSTYHTVQQASRTLYDALTMSWCCSDPAHIRHGAKLYLDAKVEETVQLNLVISNQNSDPAINQRYFYLHSAGRISPRKTLIVLN